jgi:hypothetical protein
MNRTAASFVLVAVAMVLAGAEEPPPPTASPAPSPTVTAAPRAERQDDVIVRDNFEGEDGLITSHEFYNSASFPSGGSSWVSNPSPIWEGDSGYFYRQGKWGFSGRPADWHDRYFFRMNTRTFEIGDASISWKYRSAHFGEDGFPTESSDAVDLWLRYQTEYDVYVFQFDRTDDGIQAKRKVPAQGWRGPANLVANKGVYYTLPTDADQPVVGAGKFLVTWESLRDVLPPSEKDKPNFPKLAHDGTTAYDFRVTVRNLVGGKVQIQAYRAGALVYSTTDDGRSAVAANGETQGAHVDRGLFDTVTGWQPHWARPITHPGASGFRADDIKFWVSGFEVRRLAATDAAVAAATTMPSPSIDKATPGP